MASSDEEGEIIPDCITNYHLVDYKEDPISFSKLPLQWSEDEILYGLSTEIFLRGSADNGLQEIYKKVIAWKFELSYVLPEIYLLSKDKIWIKLQKPRKSFENTIKTILITVHCLHFMKKNPEASRYTVWNHLLKAFSSYEVEPSENDLLEHMPLINEAAVRDKEIAKSKYLAALLLEMPWKNKALHEDNRTTKKSKFIDDAADGDGDEEEDNDESDESELFDSVCALCDNGGELLCCEGRCIRSFHPTGDAGAESLCASLGYTAAQVEAIQNFLCKNCQYQRHQCFVCGTLGSSNKSSGAEVFPCVSATCGHFYHPKCLAKLLHPCDETQAEEVQKNIAAGESFTCPVHKCFICKQGEDKKVYDLQFAMCRRCPKAYHRKCLPRKISFEGNGDTNIPQRAWDGLLPNRILIYCMDHKIIPGLGTPQRNHILFPGVDGKKKQHRLDLLSGKEKVVAEKRSTVSGNVTERTVVKMKKKVEKDYAVTGGDSTKKLKEGFSRQASMSKVPDGTMKRVNNVSVQEKMYKPSTSKSSLRNDHSLLSRRLHAVKPKQQDFPSGKTKNTIAAMPGKKEACNTPPLVDPEMKKRMVALIKHSTSSFNAEEFIKKQKMLSSNACSSRFVVDTTNKTITVGKVEGSVKAVRAALKKLEEGCTTEDAKAVCEPEILKQIVKWKDKLKVYLAPFLHGMRYTSFGRHFTKVDKLKEIVDRLHWYVQDGDMIVDFCCGSNDFSLLLKERLEQMRKSCSFRNYDLIQSKDWARHANERKRIKNCLSYFPDASIYAHEVNDFNFEKRDWMSVRLEELPAGSQLIMGLNPPFGVQASLANQFIEKALKFKPKLLILIVPQETKRLDKKNPPYDLIWDDDKLLSGKSFYLPGSLDVHDQQMEQWNLETPPLYLWSRPDWTAKHKAIARRHGHLSKERKELHAQETNVETSVSNYLMEENQDCYGDFSNIVNGYGDICSILDDIPEDSDDIEHEGRRNNLSSDNLNKMQYEGKLEIDRNEISVSHMGKLGGVASLQVDDMSVDMELSTPTNSPRSNSCFKSMSESNRDAAFETHAEVYTARQGFQVLQPSFHGSHLEFGAEHAMFHTTVPKATESGYRQNEGAYLNGAYNWSTSTHYNPNG